ncbi:NUDIX domain-containing protein [Microbacterium amylolyticum]|uniref:ADP-ribose pyrophosphatase n=1 Tax=Microbacterium amylolyticum TaxID=936337 RepID=A0ABS4ZFN5_9MICO|nr:NUDIX hydrolase [Microbacterium amylolyticum]MBP2436094.1 ADP-ribose pyrophosphatase [Microbacterium amylolyticum]
MTELLRDEPLEVEVISSELAYRGAVWNIREDRFRYGDDEIVRHYVDHTGAVAVVALDEDDRVLLIQQYRHPIRTRDWEIPAGLRDVDGEDLQITAARELAEEADLTASSWERLGELAPTPGGSDEVIHLFLARGIASSGETFARDAEEADIRAEWVPLEDAVAAVMSGRMRNAALMVGVLMTAERLRRDRS